MLIVESILTTLFASLISLCTSFLINTALRYFYAEYDCLKRSNNQLFLNFIEIPDPIIFVDVTNYQLIYYNLNAESFFHEELKDKSKVGAIDLIHGDDEKSKFRQMTTELIESRSTESKETIFSVKTQTDNGVKLIKYNVLIWKTSWKDAPVFGVRLKPIRRESMQDGDLGNQSKEFYQNSLLSMENKLKNLMSNMSGNSRILQKHVENGQYQNVDNDVKKIKEEIDELSKLYVYFNNIIKVGNLKNDSKYEKTNFNIRVMILNICEHVSTHCLKVNISLTSHFSDEFPEMINSNYHPFFCMIYTFILLFNTIV